MNLSPSSGVAKRGLNKQAEGKMKQRHKNAGRERESEREDGCNYNLKFMKNFTSTRSRRILPELPRSSIRKVVGPNDQYFKLIFTEGRVSLRFFTGAMEGKEGRHVARKSIHVHTYTPGSRYIFILAATSIERRSRRRCRVVKARSQADQSGDFSIRPKDRG